MVYHNCVLKDGESVWNNGKSNVKDSRLKKNKGTERDFHSKESHFTVRVIIIKNKWKDLMANHTHQKKKKKF